MNLKRIIFSLFLLCHIAVQAQTITVDWNGHASDSLLPSCTAVIDLPDNYTGYSYSVHIEYPEYRKMGKAEAARYGLATKYPDLTEHLLIESFIGIQAKRPQLDIAVKPVIKRGGVYYRLESCKLVVEKTPLEKPAKAAARNAVERYAPNSVLAEGRWVRIAVKDNGVHKITEEELKKMGFASPGKVRLYGYGGNILAESNIESLPDDLHEVPLWRENGYVLFYAKGTTKWEYNSGRFTHSQNVYSNNACYFLTESEEAPMEFAKESLPDSLVSGEEPVSEFTDYALYEKEEKSLCSYGRVLVDKYEYTLGRTRRYEIATPGAVGGTPIIEVSFASSAEETSEVNIHVNDINAGTLAITQRSSSDLGRIAEGRFMVNGTLTDKTVITLSHKVPGSTITGYLDFIRLSYNRKLALYGSQTTFRGKSLNGGYARFLISGCNPDVKVWSINNGDVKEFAGVFDGGTYSVIAPAGTNSDLVAVNVKGTFPSVSVIGETGNQNLHSITQADMVIIVPTNGLFTNTAERLAEAHRTMDSLSVVVIKAQEIYNEFSSGTPDVTAYRRFMKMLYDRAETAADAPKYLLLFGDACYDNRFITMPERNQEDYLLCFESVNSVNAVRSYVHEDYMGLLDDGEGNNLLRNKVDIGVGRIPVTSLVEANSIVDKIIMYMKNSEAGAWQNVIALLGDDGDKSIPNQHMKDAESVAGIISEKYPSYIIDRIYWDDFVAEKSATGNRYPQVTEAIKERLEKGALIVNYSGHGGPNQLSHEMSWKAQDMSELKSPRLPLWIMASCDIAPFDLSDNSIGELALKNPAGGGVSVFTSTRTVLQRYNAILNRAFSDILLSPAANGKPIAIGDAVRIAKCSVIEANSDLSENKLQYVLLGDPALKLKYQEFRINVSLINGSEATGTFQVQAGGKLEIEGYIASHTGDTIKDFTGVLYSNLFDGAEDVSTRNNTNLGSFTYTAYNKNIYSGCDSVINGRFTISMPIPMDISYSEAMGHLNLFALDSALQHSAQGHYNNLIFNGTASDTENDGKGPEIKAYLNSTSFVDGDKVNATPCLLVELHDINGINTVGTGIGHDITAIIDGNAKYTYNLNSVFKPVVGDFTRGTIMFPLDRLEEGEHTLMVRAWDFYNNSSTTTITFVVEPDMAPEISSIEINPSPVVAGCEIKFHIYHNRPQSEIDVTVEIYNIHGQLLWRKAEKSVADGLVHTCSWNGSGQAGQPLPTGVYVARISMATDGEQVVKGAKFLVTGNK